MRSRGVRRWIFAFVPALLLVASIEIGARLIMSDGPLAELRRKLHSRLDPDARLMHESLYQLKASELFVPDEYAGYRLRDTTDPASRQPPFLPAAPKSPGEIRVVCAGDSVTFGRSFDDSWPGHLQRMLDQTHTPGLRFVVFNAGTPGHNVLQCKHILQSRWIGLEPDVVVWHESARFAESADPAPAMNARRFAVLQQVYRVRSLYLLLAAKQAWDARGGDAVARFDAPLDRNSPARADAARDLALWCGERGVSLFILVDYLTHDGRGIQRANTGFAEVATLAGDLGKVRFDAVPLLETFRAYEGGGDTLFTDLVHLKPEGMELVARSVHENLRTRIAEGQWSAKRAAP